MKTEVLKIKLMEMIPEEVVEYAGNITNLKLYDANYLAYKIGEKNDNIEEMNDLFNNFCDESFEEFMGSDEYDEAVMEGLKMCNIGTTSSFRIDTEDGLYGGAYYYSDYNNASKEEKKQMLYEEFLYLHNTDESDFEEMDTDEIELLIEEMKDYVESFNDIIEAYKEIEDFKINQVEYFKEYIEDYGYDFEIPEGV